MLRSSGPLLAAALLLAGDFIAADALARGPRGRSGYYGRGHSGYRTGSSSYSYSNPYLNPYSYESQALPYWLKPGYDSNSGGGGGGYYYSTPSRPDRYGAIAYSPSTGTYGYSYSRYSQTDAEREALQQCDADDRKVIGWMRNAYGALAVGDTPDQYAWAWGATREAAKQSALAKCQELSANSYIKLTVFSGN